MTLDDGLTLGKYLNFYGNLSDNLDTGIGGGNLKGMNLHSGNRLSRSKRGNIKKVSGDVLCYRNYPIEVFNITFCLFNYAFSRL